MKKGKLIGKGMTAEVYEWGDDRVVKLFFKKFSDGWIKNEARIGHVVHAAGVSAPAVFDFVEINHRKGIIFQRIFGKSMLNQIQEEQWNVLHFSKKLARLHFNIHQSTANSLPAQKDKFTNLIKRSSNILGSKANQIIEYMQTLPSGESICHGDLHFNNVIVSKNGLVTIDWTNAYRGNPLADVARTCLMIASPAAFPRTTNIFMDFSQFGKWFISINYANEYMKLAKVRYEKIDEWMLPAAAAKLNDKVPGEELWLINMIHQRLNWIKNLQKIR